MHATMTPRQRWLAQLDGQAPDRIPTDYWATGEFHARLKRDLQLGDDDEQLWHRLHIDAPRHFGVGYTGPKLHEHPEADIWGIRRTRIQHGSGTYDEATHHPLAEFETVEQLHAYPWPDATKHNFDDFAKAVKADDGHRIRRIGSYEPFLLYCYLRGMERAFEDMLIEPEFLQAALQHIFDFSLAVNRRLWELADGKADIMYLAEDLGAQTGPLFGLETYRKLIMPHQQQMAAAAKSFNVRLFYHTDGSARSFLPDLIDTVGIHILNPIQWRCPGMERDGLVRDFASRIVFHGAMDNQFTLPFGSTEQVIAEVKENVALFKGSRWICAPCHNIQPLTPTQNVIAMYETIHTIGAVKG